MSSLRSPGEGAGLKVRGLSKWQAACSGHPGQSQLILRCRCNVPSPSCCRYYTCAWPNKAEKVKHETKRTDTISDHGPTRLEQNGLRIGLPGCGCFPTCACHLSCRRGHANFVPILTPSDVRHGRTAQVRSGTSLRGHQSLRENPPSRTP